MSLIVASHFLAGALLTWAMPIGTVIAVGDGANDLPMLEKAGLGIAFRAKAKLRQAADTSISTGGLDSILYLLGISARELEELLSLP